MAIRLPLRIVVHSIILLLLLTVNGAYAHAELPKYVIKNDQSEWRDFEVLLTVDPTQGQSIASISNQQVKGKLQTSRLHLDQLADYWLGWTVENATDLTQRRLVGFDESYPKQVVLKMMVGRSVLVVLIYPYLNVNYKQNYPYLKSS